MNSTFIQNYTSLISFISLVSCITFTLVTNAQSVVFPSAEPDEDCSLYTPLANNQNINDNTTYSVCGESDEFESYNVNLNGGTIRICGNVSLSGNFNRGTIVISCGSTLRFPSTLRLSESFEIYNYGTLEINGDLEFQNNNSILYNEASTSRLFINGNFILPQNATRIAYIKNNAYIKVNMTFRAYDGGHILLSDNSIIDTENMDYGTNCGSPANRFNYSDTSGNAIIRYESNAFIKASFTDDANINIHQATGSSVSFNGCGSWGNATILANAPSITPPLAPDPSTCTSINCFTQGGALTADVITIQVNNSASGALIEWMIESHEESLIFDILRSQDGILWEHTHQSIDYQTSTQNGMHQVLDRHPYEGESYYKLRVLNADGNSTFSKIQKFTYTPSSKVILTLSSSDLENQFEVNCNKAIEWVTIRDMNGKILSRLNIPSSSTYHVSVDMSPYPPGLYILCSNVGTKKIYKNEL